MTALTGPTVRQPQPKPSKAQRNDELEQRVRHEAEEDERAAAWLDAEREPVEA
jgi:phage protein D